jgi:hypothetical protein
VVADKIRPVVLDAPFGRGFELPRMLGTSREYKTSMAPLLNSDAIGYKLVSCDERQITQKQNGQVIR